MKDKVFTFIIGLLVGAIIATLGFYLYEKTNNKEEVTNITNQAQMRFPGEDMSGEPPAMPDGESGDNNSRPTPPDMQNGSIQDGNQMTEPPAKPDGDNDLRQRSKDFTNQNNTETNE